MDETDNNGAILSQHLFCILDTGLIESSFAAVLRDSCGGGRPSLSSLLENFFGCRDGRLTRACLTALDTNVRGTNSVEIITLQSQPVTGDKLDLWMSAQRGERRNQREL